MGAIRSAAPTPRAGRGIRDTPLSAHIWKRRPIPTHKPESETNSPASGGQGDCCPCRPEAIRSAPFGRGSAPAAAMDLRNLLKAAQSVGRFLPVFVIPPQIADPFRTRAPAPLVAHAAEINSEEDSPAAQSEREEVS